MRDGLIDVSNSMRDVLQGVDHHEIVDDVTVADLGSCTPQLRGKGFPSSRSTSPLLSEARNGEVVISSTAATVLAARSRVSWSCIVGHPQWLPEVLFYISPGELFTTFQKSTSS